MSPAEGAVLFGVSLFVVAGLVAVLPVGECPECSHCSRTRAEKARKQRELQHDLTHKGAGWNNTTPDRYSCQDENCPRNPHQSGPTDYHGGPPTQST